MQSSEAWVSEVLMQLMFVKHFEDRKLYVSTNVEEKKQTQLPSYQEGIFRFANGDVETSCICKF